jgi:oxygen-dependent protoporphyrinogen oxidase
LAPPDTIRGMAAEIEQCDVVVVGAGMAGLAAAWDLRDRAPLVLESTDRVGGRLQSVPRGEHWLNLGAHVFAGEDSGVGRLVAETGAVAADIPGTLTGVSYGGRLVVDGRVELYPFRLPISWRGKVEFMRAGLKLRRLVAEYAKVVEPRPGESLPERQARMLAFMDDRSAMEVLGPLSPEVDAFFRCTLTRGTGEPEEIAAGYGAGYFHMVWDKSGGLARNIVGGTQTLMDALAAPHGDRVRVGARTTRVAQDADGVTVEYEQDGERRAVRARTAIVATQAFVTREIVEGLPADMLAAMHELRYGPNVCAAFLTDEDGPQRWDDVYAIATPNRSITMLFNMDNIQRATGAPRAKGTSFMVYAVANLGRKALAMEDEAVLDAYQRDLEEVLPEVRGRIVERVLRKVDGGLPFPHVGRGRLQAALTQPTGRIHLAGDYLGSWYAETAALTGAWAAANAREQLGA